MDALDKIYKDKFKDFSFDPSPGAFEKINAQLPKGSAGSSTSPQNWKTMLSSKTVLVKIIAVVIAFTAATYVLLKVSTKEDSKNNPEKKDMVPSNIYPTDTTTLQTEEKSTRSEEKKEKRKNKKSSDTPNSVATPDTTTTMLPAANDTASIIQKEETKPRKTKRQKKYENFYKKGTNNADSTIKLFK